MPLVGLSDVDINHYFTQNLSAKLCILCLIGRLEQETIFLDCEGHFEPDEAAQFMHIVCANKVSIWRSNNVNFSPLVVYIKIEASTYTLVWISNFGYECDKD